jgi:hypothetical protein
MRSLGHLVAFGIVAAVVGATSVEAAQRLVIPRNSVGSTQIKDGSILRADLAKSTIDYLTAGAPPPRAAGVTVAQGEHGDRVRVSAPNIRGGNLLGQVEYLGGLVCPTLGPWLRVEATFFDASGLVVATGADWETAPVAGVRYPLEVFGGSTAVRAEAVASVSCL